MDHGQGNANAPLRDLSILPPGAIVTPDDYAQNMARINLMRAALEEYETQNRVGLQRFAEQENELRQRVEAGREAERVLAQLQSRRSTQPAVPISQGGNISVASSSYASNQFGSATLTGSPGQTNTIFSNNPNVGQVAPEEMAQNRGRAYPSSSSTFQQQYAHDWENRQSRSHYPNASFMPVQGSQCQTHPGAWNGFSNPYQLVNEHIPQYPPHTGSSGAANPRSHTSYAQNGQTSHIHTTSHTQPAPRDIPSASDSSVQTAPGSYSKSHLYKLPRSEKVYSSQNGSRAANTPKPRSESQPDVRSRQEVFLAIQQDVLKVIKGLRPEMVQEIMKHVLKELKPILYPSGNIQVPYPRQDLDAWTQDTINKRSSLLVTLLQGLSHDIILQILKQMSDSLQSLESTSDSQPAISTHTSSSTVTNKQQSSASVRSAALQPSIPSTAFTSSATSRPLLSEAPNAGPSSDPSTALFNLGPSTAVPLVTETTSSQGYSAENPAASKSLNSGLSSSMFNSSIQHSPFIRETGQQSKPPVTQAHGSPTLQSSGTSEIHLQEVQVPSLPSSWIPSKVNKSCLAHDILRALGHPSGQTSSTLSASESHVKRRRVDEGSGELMTSSQKRQRMEAVPEPVPQTDTTRQPAVSGSSDVEIQIGQHQETFAEQSYLSHTGGDTIGSASVEPEILSQAGSLVKGAEADVDAEIYEIKTPGALQMEEEEAEKRDELGSEMEVQVPSSRLSSPPIEVIQPLSPIQSHSNPSGPPSSRTATPQVPELSMSSSSQPSQPIIHHNLSLQSPTTTTPAFSEQSSHQEASVSSIQFTPPHPSKVNTTTTGTSSQIPLFLPSPSSSHGDNSSPSGQYSHFESNANVDFDSDSKFILDSTLLGEPEPGPSHNTQATARNTGKRQKSLEDSDGVVGYSWKRSPEARVTISPLKPKIIARMDYVDAPPLPKWAKDFNASARKAGKKKALDIEEESSEVEGIEDESVVPTVVAPKAEKSQQLEKERQIATKVSLQRLRPTPCHWRYCDAILESGERLIAHAALHADDKADWGTYSCEWENCTRRFSDEKKLAHHLKEHAIERLYCAYEGCNESFPTPLGLTLHQKHFDHRMKNLRPEAKLIQPDLTIPLPPMPDQLPSYMSVPRRVIKPTIDEELHKKLGAKVAANIVCYVPPSGRSYQAAPSRHSQRIADKIAAVELAMLTDPDTVKGLRVSPNSHDNYDAWISEHERTSPAFCSDMASAEVTQMVMNGLVLVDFEGMDDSGNYGVGAYSDDNESPPSDTEVVDGPGPREEDDLDGMLVVEGGVDEIQHTAGNEARDSADPATAGGQLTTDHDGDQETTGQLNASSQQKPSSEEEDVVENLL